MGNKNKKEGLKLQLITLTLGLNDVLVYVNINSIAYFGKTEKHGYYVEKQYTEIVFNNGEKILVKETPEKICNMIMKVI